MLIFINSQTLKSFNNDLKISDTELYILQQEFIIEKDNQPYSIVYNKSYETITEDQKIEIENKSITNLLNRHFNGDWRYHSLIKNIYYKMDDSTCLSYFDFETNKHYTYFVLYSIYGKFATKDDILELCQQYKVECIDCISGLDLTIKIKDIDII